MLPPGLYVKCTALFLRLFSSRSLILRSKEYSVQNSGRIGLTSNFQVIFHVICLLNRIEDVTKINWWQKFEISQENFYEGVSFSKVTNLQCLDCNFAIKRAHHRYFLEYVPKTSCLKNNILRKKSIVDQLLNKVATL